MGYDKSQLDRIFATTAGRCHLCHRPLARRNYGVAGKGGAWEVDHSIPRARGGSDHGNNLRPAHIGCNRSKQAVHNRAIRLAHGHKRSPLSVREIESLKARNTLVGGAGLAVVGGLALGPFRAVAGAVIGAIAGHETRVE